MKLKQTVLWGAVALLLLSTSALVGEEMTFSAARDNTLFDTKEDLSNGAGIYLFAGNTAGMGVRRALLAFDLSAIPSDAIVHSAELTLDMDRTISGEQTTGLHAVTSDWGEGTSDAGGEEGGGAPATAGDATWNDAFFNTTPWTTAGGDFVAGASQSLPVEGAGLYVWGLNSELNSDVQGWVTSSATNFGWILIVDETNPATAKRFASRENKGNSPQLRVVYSIPIFADGFETGDTTQWSSTNP